MKLKALLMKLSKMDKKQLEQELIFVSTYESGSCILKKAISDLIYTGEDDPSELYTKKQLLEEGYDEEEIDSMSVEINKGEYYFCPINYKS